MNKADLHEKWSKYCDTNKLVDDMMALLNKYNHRNSEHGVCELLDKYFFNKEPLIKLFATSNHYIGNMRISTVESFDRRCNANEIQKVFYEYNLLDYPHYHIRKYEDSKGKKLENYRDEKVGMTHVTIDSLLNNATLKERCKNINQFDFNSGATKESDAKANGCYWFMSHFQNKATHSVLQSDYASIYDKSAPVLKAGTKTSRAFNKVCQHYGIDKEEYYNKMFAKYADLVSDLKRKMNFVISLNPLDYLTMSIGVSWHSCHSIANGGWKGGCLSYMLDKTSIITYVVENLEGKIHEIPKHYRQMIHYDDGMFASNRIYPADNDGALNLYDKLRGFVTTEFSELLNEDGEWIVGGSYSASRHIESAGVHYKDYNTKSECRIFYPHSKADTIPFRLMRVGHEGICTYCGREFTESSRVAHSSCRF